MNTKLLMSASAVTLAITGLLLTFLPQELLAYFTVGHSEPLILGAQLLGALYLSFALLNWMAKGNLIGGIYSRPVAIGNFMHFMMGGLIFIKLTLKSSATPELIAITVLYCLFAMLFGIVTFTHPAARENNARAQTA